MNTEQERAAFEAWITASPYEKPVNLNPDSSGFPGQYRAYEVQLAWEAWQARAALQSQDREDAARLDWLQQSDGRFFKLLHITSIVGRGFSPTNSSGKWFSSLRDAIDHARRVEGGGKRLTPAEDRKVKPGDVVEIISPWLSGGLYDVGDRFVVTEVQEGSGVFFEYPGHTGPIRVFLAEWEYRLV